MLLLLSALLPDVVASAPHGGCPDAAVDAAGVIRVICIPSTIDSISDHVLTDVFALGEGLQVGLCCCPW